MDWKKLIEFSTSSTPAPVSQMYNFMPVPAFRSPKPHQNSKDQEARDPRFMQLVKQNMQVFWNDRMYEIYNATGKFLEASRPNLYWTPCAAHCLDLMLEDIFKLPNLKKAFERAISIHGYIYNRLGLLNMMRRFTNFKELVKPAKTRFATAFLTLQRLYSKRNELRTMFTSDEWKNSKWAKEPQGKKTAQILLMPSFWNTVHIALKFACPLVHVLRLVDGEKKPPMGYIYEAMDRAKEVIANSFDENEDKYKDVFEIIDRRWNVQLHRPLHAAGFYLNPEFYYKNPEAAKDKEISTGLFQCISKLVKNVEVQDRICEELTRYEKAEGLFGIPMAVRQRTTRVPEYRRQHQLPLARIKKIMKLDEAVKMISADTPVLLAKACEIFILELTLRSWLHTEQNNYRTLQRCDIAKAISNEELLDFLTTVVPLDPQEEVTGSDLEENEPHPDNQIHLPMLNLNALGGTSHAPYYGIPGNPSAVHDSTINFLAEYKPGSK